jgi:hypothetical protein
MVSEQPEASSMAPKMAVSAIARQREIEETRLFIEVGIDE